MNGHFVVHFNARFCVERTHFSKMEIEHFDTDFFIDEIQKRPAIWDMESPDYKNKVIKKRKWEEMVEIFCDAGDSLEKKKLLGTTLTKKWKSIRDNYMRESKRQKNPSGSGSFKHVPYVYFGKLKFLESSVVNKDTESNFETPEATNSDLNNAENEDLIPPPREQIEGTRKKQKVNAVDKQIVDILEKSLHARQQLQTAQLTKEDDDKLFCLSLYTELKKVPENGRLSTKIELLNVIQKAQNRALPQQINQYHYQYAYSTPTYSGYTTARSSSASQQCSATPPTPPPQTATWVPSPSSQDSDSLHLFE